MDARLTKEDGRSTPWGALASRMTRELPLAERADFLHALLEGDPALARLARTWAIVCKPTTPAEVPRG